MISFPKILTLGFLGFAVVVVILDAEEMNSVLVFLLAVSISVVSVVTWMDSANEEDLSLVRE